MTTPPARSGSGWQGLVATLFLLVGLVAVIYLALVFVVGRTTPAHLTVGGVDVSSMAPDEARHALEQESERLLAQPVTVVADGNEHRFTPAELGLDYDADRSLRGTTGRTWDPRDLWARATDEVDRDWAVTVDEDRLHHRLRGLAGEIDVPSTRATIELQGTEAEVTEGSAGTALDVRETGEAVQDAWPHERRVEGTVEQVEPEVTADVLQRFADEVLEPALSAPITLLAVPVEGPRAGPSGESGDPESPEPSDGSSASASAEDELTTTHRVTIPPAQVAEMLSIGGSAGEPTIEVDATRWRDGLPDDHPFSDREAREADLRLEDGSVRIEPAQVGRSVSTGDIEQGVRDAVRAQEREAQVTVSVTRPYELGDGWTARHLSTFTTMLPGGEENEGRTHNIRTLTREIHGTVVPAGEQFSLLEVMGEPTKEAGYEEAHVISNGTLSNAVGGGLSQVSTAVYNMAFIAGVQLDEHKPHSYYIARYPEGREATLWYPAIDNTWTNDTDSPMIISAQLDGRELTMSLYGEKQYDVDATTRPRQNVVPFRKYHSNDPECVDQGGVDGFDVTVERILTPYGDHDGEERTEAIETHYDPSDEVFCTNPESPEYSGSQDPPSDEYRPFSQREQDVKDDARAEAERELREDEQADAEAQEEDGRPEGTPSSSAEPEPSGSSTPQPSASSAPQPSGSASGD
ncbi:VanW family protein [Kytococcus sedentarius]|uniref:VanW family protein n=1 Tax=Kytococcus sedentarius TaxID=1276 RepID=UPI0035BC657C